MSQYLLFAQAVTAGLPSLDIDRYEFPDEVIGAIERDAVLCRRVLPVLRSGHVLVLAHPGGPPSRETVAWFEDQGMTVEWVITDEPAFERALPRYLAKL